MFLDVISTLLSEIKYLTSSKLSEMHARCRIVELIFVLKFHEYLLTMEFHKFMMFGIP